MTQPLHEQEPTGPRLRLRGDAVEWRAVDGEVVALVRASGEYISVNRAGALLWPLVLEGARTDELVAALAGAYGLEGGRALADVEAFTAALRARGLLADEP